MDQGTIALDPSIAEVNLQRCAGCGQCVAACPYKAIELCRDDPWGRLHAKVNGFLCKGCGTCGATCPNKAMSLLHFNDRELVEEIIGALAVNPAEVT
jgi:heterodisulfide reductase subunit A